MCPSRYATPKISWFLSPGTQEDAIAEKSALAGHLRRTTSFELSPEKTKVTAVAYEFLCCSKRLYGG